MTRGMLAGTQTTLRSHATVKGIGVHSGSPVTLTLHPAEPNSGIVFLRSGARWPARPGNRGRLPLRHCHRIRNRARRSKRPRRFDHGTRALPHCTASALIMPSSKSTDRKFRSWTAAPRRLSKRSIRPASSRSRHRAATSRCSSPFASARTACFGELLPHARGLRIETEIEFDHPMIGRQSLCARCRAGDVPP